MKYRNRQRQAFDRFRAGRSVADIPDFRESLALLLHDERYSYTDIAMMFGVSHERVRQWERSLGISHRGREKMRRVWVDAERRFRPLGSDGDAAVRTAMRRARRVDTVEAIRTSVAICLRHAQSIQTTPLTLSEMWEAWSGEQIDGARAQAKLAGLWSAVGTGGRSPKETLAHLRKTVGIVLNRPGARRRE